MSPVLFCMADGNIMTYMLYHMFILSNKIWYMQDYMKRFMANGLSDIFKIKILSKGTTVQNNAFRMILYVTQKGIFWIYYKSITNFH